MSRIISAIKRFFKGLAVVTCCMGLVVYTIGIFVVQSDELAKDIWPIFIVMDGLMLLFLYLLLRKKPAKISPTSPADVPLKHIDITTSAKLENQETPDIMQLFQQQLDAEFNEPVAPLISVEIGGNPPPEVLESMRQGYSPMQAEGDLRILSDCLNLMSTTKNIETFFSRSELGLQKALTLRHAEQAKVKGVLNAQKLVDSVMNCKQLGKRRILQASFEAERDKIALLSTANGKCNRWKKYLELLKSYEIEYDFDCEQQYADTLSYVEQEISSLEQTAK